MKPQLQRKSLEDSEIYKQLDEKMLSIITASKKSANKILEQSGVEKIYERLEKNSDYEEYWYSYIIVVNSMGKKTQELNETYINEQIINKISSSKVIFRFESGNFDNSEDSHSGECCAI